MINIDLDVLKIDKICDYIRKINPPDEEIIHIHRSGMPCFQSVSAKVWKELNVQENAKVGPRFVKYVPMPMFWNKTNTQG